MFRNIPVTNETPELGMDQPGSELTSSELDGVSGGAEFRVRKHWTFPAKHDALTDGVLIVRY
jgi:hypothetical protein